MSLMALCFVPSINQLIVDGLISGLENDLLNIAGQIEWFDLFNETLLAFLIVPLYFSFNKVIHDKESLKSRIIQLLLIGFILYSIVSLGLYLYAGSLSAYMNAPPESISYLRLETIGFVMGFVASFMYVVFVVVGKWKYFVSILIAKIIMLSAGNLILIPEYGIIGVAITNIIVNIIISAVSLSLLYNDGLLQFKLNFKDNAIVEWLRVGIFSGSQIFLDNFIYMIIVVKMINEVSSVGVYWLANNFIWGWLLIPIIALVEIVKRDYLKGYFRMHNYILFVVLIVFIWLCSVPLWGIMFNDVIQAQDPAAVLNILYMVVPFYIAYAFAAVFDGVLISVGKTWYLLGISLIVNIGYYGVVYLLFLSGFFVASIEFIVMMFGFGMVIHLIFSILFYLHSK